MSGISVSIAMLLIKGIPEGFLATFALHVFTRTKIVPKTYLLFTAINIAATYLMRLLPISIGVNTVLALIILVVVYQSFYRATVQLFIRAIIVSVAFFVVIAIAEVLNMLLLFAIFGQAEAEALFVSGVGLTGSLSSIPSTIFTAIFIFVGYLVFRKIDKRKIKDGETGKEAGK